MPYNPNIHHRKSIRLKGYDYSQAGLYFITICVQDRECLFGEIVDGAMILNDAGQMVENVWLKLPKRFTNIELHEFVVMPNHFHAIMEIVGAPLVVDQNNTVDQNSTVDQNNMVDQNEIGQPQGIAPTIKPKTVGDMVGAFQSIVTVEYIRGVKQLGWQPFNGKLWQRNYWEHIIRHEQAYHRISEYIINNPKNWDLDKFYNQ
ncbi:transposase [bacterium]|nr:transposase [bacterium]